jgi:uncharacterized protein
MFHTKENILTKEMLEPYKDLFPKGAKVAIKMHMGEENNKTCLRAEDVKPVIEFLKEQEPFIIDTPVAYKGGRHNCEVYLKTAKDNGFSKESLNCPVIISGDYQIVKTKHMDFEVCKEMYETEYMVVLSHVKGHDCTGIGGAIKNLSMGGATVKSKKEMHSLGKPIIKGECKLCKTCEEYCCSNCIKVDKELNIDLDNCWGCGVCVETCPHNVLTYNVSMDELLAEGAWASIQNKKVILYINMIKRVTLLCDCHSNSGKIISEDKGILIGTDPVKIDRESIKLIGKEIFIKEHHKDPERQVDFMAKQPSS